MGAPETGHEDMDAASEASYEGSSGQTLETCRMVLFLFFLDRTTGCLVRLMSVSGIGMVCGSIC